MGLFSKPMAKAPTPPPGVKAVSAGRTTYWTADPGPHTCEFQGGQQISRTTVRWRCHLCDATKDTYDPDPDRLG